MITLTKKKNYIYSIIGIVLLLVIGFFINYFQILFPWLIFIIGISITILFVCGIEDITFKGRFSNMASLLWISYFVLSILAIALFLAVIILTSGLFGIHLTGNINTSIVTPFLYSILFYFIFKFFQLLYKRLQDLNQPGYYLIGLLPIICWFIGVKIFKSGYRIFGILVFLNLSVAIPYILLIHGNKESNYFGINSKHITKYKKEAKRIRKAKSLNDSEKEELINKLKNKYVEIEEREKEEFKNNEVTRLIKKERLQTNYESDINQNRKDYYENQVNEKIGKYYFKYNWC